MLSLAIAARRPDGRLLFTEKLVFEPARNPPRQTGVMDSFDVFGNVILLTPKEPADRIAARLVAEVDLAAGVAHGACRLPNDAGLIYKVLGRETAQVKAKVREFWGIVREEVTGARHSPAVFLALSGGRAAAYHQWKRRCLPGGNDERGCLVAGKSCASRPRSCASSTSTCAASGR